MKASRSRGSASHAAPGFPRIVMATRSVTLRQLETFPSHMTRSFFTSEGFQKETTFTDGRSHRA